MAGIYVNDKGTWKLPKSVWVKSGTWRVCKNVYINNRGYWQELIKTIDITSSKSNFNLWEYVGSPTEPISLIVNIASGIEIFSNDTSGNRTPALTVGNFPTNSTVIVNNNGYISGGGGFGGVGGIGPSGSASNGTNGGDGIVKGSSNNFDITITNTGTIAGGGGGGSAGSAVYYEGPPNPQTGVRPRYWVSGGNGGQGAGITGFSRTQGGNGQNVSNGVSGGNGGSLGEDGLPTPTGNGSSFGAGGKAIGSDIEVAVSGTIIGAVG